MDNEHDEREGRTLEEYQQYRVDNRLRLRDEPLSREERRQAIDAIFERDSELLQILADA